MKRNSLICLLLVAVMVLSIMPISALAVETVSGDTNEITTYPNGKNSGKLMESISVEVGNVNNRRTVLVQSGTSAQQEFSFDKEVKSYDILLWDAGTNVDKLTSFSATTTTDSDMAAIAQHGKLTDASDTASVPEGKYIAGADIKENAVNPMLALPITQKKLTLPAMNDKNPLSLNFVVGECADSSIATTKKKEAAYQNMDIYRFNLYRKATLSGLTVAYEDNTAIEMPVFDLYATNYTVENVKQGTEKLTVTAPAYTEGNTEVKYIDKTGKYVKGTDATTFTATLDDYTAKADGSVVIPFMLDYTGEGCGVDGYYTLTVKFAAEENDYTPVFSTQPEDKTVKAGESVTLTAAVQPVEDDKTNPVTYQWLSGENAGTVTTEISGATGATYTFTPETAGTTYYVCKATRSGKTASSNVAQVTVTSDSGDSTIHGYVKHIKFTSTDGEYNFFDSFNKDTGTYTLSLPNDNTCEKGKEYKDYFDLRYIKMMVTPDEEGRYGYLLVDSMDLPEAEAIHRDSRTVIGGESMSRYIYFSTKYSESKDVFDDYAVKKILGTLKRGSRYRLTLTVFEKGKEDQGDTYIFETAIYPVLRELVVSADGKELPSTPQFEYPAHTTNANSPSVVREYSFTTSSDKITLTGYSLLSDIEFYVTKEDGTVVNFVEKESGRDQRTSKLTLSEYAQNDKGQYVIPLTLKQTGKYPTECTYTILMTKKQVASWGITKQPQCKSEPYNKGDEVLLSVETDAAANMVSYQWQEVHSGWYSDITGATNASYTAPTANWGTVNYRCAVTDLTTGEIAYSDVVRVSVALGKPSPAEIKYQPGKYILSSTVETGREYQTTYEQGEKITPIYTQLHFPEGNADLNSSYPVSLDLKWYHNTNASTEGAQLIESDNYGEGVHSIYDGLYFCVVPYALDIGEHYFYFTATMVDRADAANCTSVTSDFVKITILPRGELEGFTGKGTEADPYLVTTVADFSKIDEYVLSGNSLSGAVFRMANDITLPANWEPIGRDDGGNGKNLLAFSGIIDGGGNTLTVSPGGRPLLEYTRDATVKNLNIFGEEINGAGLLEKVTVDYGIDGIYQEDTDPDVIIIDNVTLKKGSKTKMSGLAAGGFNSGINNIIIKNCTIEEGVVVGYTKDQSKIGSFVGELNGRIENSVSYATVYGVNKVGGLAASKGQSMGDCIITNSAFLGAIEATGGKVGGILGSGYISPTAPNTPPVTIRNCYVVADITANSTPVFISGDDAGSGIGGILGSEIGMSVPWNNSYITDNYFCGTIIDTNSDNETSYKRVGGIMGELGCLYYRNKLHYENNYYLASDNYHGIGYQRLPDDSWNPDTESFIAKSEADFKNGSVTALLNNGAFKNWVQYTSEDGTVSYPVHGDAVVAIRLEVSGKCKDHYVGDALDLTGIKINAVFTDGSTKALELNEVEVTGYDKNNRGVQTVTLKYGASSAEIDITVLYRPTGDPTKDNITVKFTLLGDEKHTTDSPTANGGPHVLAKKNLQTWIAQTPYTVGINATVKDVFEMALTEAGMTWSNPTGNYVESITYNDVTLGEFTNGPDSGWMYTINGKNSNTDDENHPLFGVSEMYLDDGDQIVFHYTDDWHLEKDSEELSKPGTSGGATIKPEDKTETTLSPEVEVNSKGEANAVIDENAISNTIADAKIEQADTIVIAPDVKGNASKVSVELPKSGVDNIAKQTNADLKVETDIADITIPQKSLDDLAKQSGSKVTISAEAVKDTDNVKLEIAVDGKSVEKLSGGITVSVPAKDEKSGNVLVIVNSDGSETIVKKSVVDGKNVEAVLDGSCTVKVVDNSKHFDDTVNHWSKDAVAFASSHELFSGTSPNTFAPDTSMSRAMLATVLYRLEDAVATGSNAFADVPEGTWYTDAVTWASNAGIVTGTGSGFDPNGNVTREQLATMLYRYAKTLGMSTDAAGDLSKFSDGNKTSSWAKDAMSWAVGSGLISGKGNSVLDPTGSATRAEVAAILQRLIALMVK